MSLLIAIPVKASLNAKLRGRLAETTRALMTANPGATLAIHENEPALEVPPQGHKDYVWTRAHNLAVARNDLLDKHLAPEHTRVLWIDADIIGYSPGLPRLLREQYDGGIIAPMLMIEGTSIYYDTYTHIDARGKQASAAPPYFDDPGDPIHMSCLGGCYMADAEIYRQFRYSAHNGPGMEHYELMQHAHAAGYPIYLTRKVRVYHANLPHWGESFH